MSVEFIWSLISARQFMTHMSHLILLFISAFLPHFPLLMISLLPFLLILDINLKTFVAIFCPKIIKVYGSNWPLPFQLSLNMPCPLVIFLPHSVHKTFKCIVSYRWLTQVYLRVNLPFVYCMPIIFQLEADLQFHTHLLILYKHKQMWFSVLTLQSINVYHSKKISLGFSW